MKLINKHEMAGGGLFQLIAYGAQDRCITGQDWRRFEEGEIVSWKCYIRYISENVFAELYGELHPEHKEKDGTLAYHYSMRKWVKENVAIRLLLRHKFAIETGTKWKQIDSSVFSHLEFREMPSKGMRVREMRDEELFEFCHKNCHLFPRSVLKRLIDKEPVVRKEDKHVLLYQIERYLKNETPLSIDLIGQESTQGNPEVTFKSHTKFEVESVEKHHADEYVHHTKELRRQQKQQRKAQQRQDKQRFKRG